MALAGPDGSDGREQQSEALLRTKLFVPPTRPKRVTRARLFEQLEHGLDKALILISAPAGYGKTTLVSGWLMETGLPAAWLSLDEDDNDPVCFLQYFISALQKIVPTIQMDIMGVLQDRQPAATKLLLNILINEISQQPGPFVLVLDDFHAIRAPAVVEIVAHLLEHLPPQMHVALLSRTDPPLPLARLRAQDQLVDIRAGQLRFTQAEIGLFLDEVMGLKLSAPDILALEARTEGWIAGLQLASIALQATAAQAPHTAPGSDALHGFVSAFTGSHYYIMDYLAEEVLGLQTEATRLFLLQSSILERMCGPLCEAVTQAGQGQETLEALEQMNLFILPLDSERRWYRYHHLFSDVLNRRLEQVYPQTLPELHRRAAGWYEQNGFFFDAIRHTLLAGDKVRAAQLVDQNGCLLLMRGEVNNLLHWIEAVEPYSQTLPWIAIQKAWALCLSGQQDRAEGPLQGAAQLIASLGPREDLGTMLGAVAAGQAFRASLQGDASRAAHFARQALADLPAGNDFSCSLRSAATSILGDASLLQGDLVEAQRAYAEAVLISQASGNIAMTIMTQTNLAETMVEQGQLHQAARNYTETLQKATLDDGQVFPLAMRVYAGLGRIAYEWNQLEEAARQIHQCIELSLKWGSAEFQAVGYVLLAGLERARGLPEKARQAGRAAEQLVGEHAFAPWQSISLQTSLARIWIAQGDLEKAADLVQKSGLAVGGMPEEGELSSLQALVSLARLRLHLARGEYEAGLVLSERLLQRLAGYTGRTIEILVLRALAWQGKRDTRLALEALEAALSLARPEGYRRIFLDEGEAMAKLLYQARTDRPRGGYAAELLEMMAGAQSPGIRSAPGRALPPAQLLIEPLSGRELEVLQLIEAGCSNQEIGAKLVISLPTVKRHISNIYAKLGASSRTQAIARGKELGLFE